MRESVGILDGLGNAATLTLAATLVGLVALGGCGSRPDWLTESQQLSGPMVLTTRLVWTDARRNEVLSVNPAADTEAGELRVRRIALEETPTAAVLVPGVDEAAPPRGVAMLTPDSRELHVFVV